MFLRNTRHKKIMKYALCVKLCQHNFIIVLVHKLLVHGHCSESGLHSLPSRISRCPRLASRNACQKTSYSFELAQKSYITWKWEEIYKDSRIEFFVSFSNPSFNKTSVKSSSLSAANAFYFKICHPLKVR